MTTLFLTMWKATAHKSRVSGRMARYWLARHLVCDCIPYFFNAAPKGKLP